MALPTNVTAGTTGHVAHTNEVHGILNGAVKSAANVQLGSTANPHLAFIGTGTLDNFGSPGKEPSIYRIGITKLGVCAWTTVFGPWADVTPNYGASGFYSALVVLMRDTSANDNSIIFAAAKEGGVIKSWWAFEQAADPHLVVKSIHGTHGPPYAETFAIRQEWRYPTLLADVCQIGFVNSNVGLFNAEGWADTQFGGGYGVMYVDRCEVTPTTNPTAGGIFYMDNADNYWMRTAAGAIRRVATAPTAGWTAATGTATRTTFATGSVTLAVLAEHVKALIDDLTTRGQIGA